MASPTLGYWNHNVLEWVQSLTEESLRRQSILFVLDTSVKEVKMQEEYNTEELEVKVFRGQQVPDHTNFSASYQEYNEWYLL